MHAACDMISHTSVISVKLSRLIHEELKIEINGLNNWTDSDSVLKSIKND